MNNNKVANLDKYKFPITDDSEEVTGVVPWQFGIKQGIQAKKIRSSTAYFKNDTGQPTFDSKGIISNSNNFIQTATSFGGGQSFTTTSYVDATNSSVTFTLKRRTLALILLNVQANLVESVGNTADAAIAINIDGNSGFAPIQLNSGVDNNLTMQSHTIQLLGSGSHTIKVQGKLITIHAGSPSLSLNQFTWTYLLLGT